MVVYSQNNSPIHIEGHHNDGQQVVIQGNMNQISIGDSNCIIELQGNGNTIHVVHSRLRMEINGNGNVCDSIQSKVELSVQGNANQVKSEFQIQPVQVYQCQGFGNQFPQNTVDRTIPVVNNNVIQANRVNNSYQANSIPSNQRNIAPSFSNNPLRDRQQPNFSNSRNAVQQQIAQYNNRGRSNAMEVQMDQEAYGYNNEQDEYNEQYYHRANQQVIRAQQKAQQQARRAQQQARRAQIQARRLQQQARRQQQQARRQQQNARKQQENARKQQQNARRQHQQAMRQHQQAMRNPGEIYNFNSININSSSQNPLGGLFNFFQNQRPQQPLRNNNRANRQQPRNNNPPRENDRRQQPQLPDHGLTSTQLQRLHSHHHTGPQQQCTICFMDISYNDEAMFLHCFHSFHSYCIQTWLKKCSKCPICNQNVRKNL